MNFNKKQIINIIQQEIDWHKTNRNEINMPDNWVEGFINGLKQIKKVFKLIK